MSKSCAIRILSASFLRNVAYIHLFVWVAIHIYLKTTNDVGISAKSLTTFFLLRRVGPQAIPSQITML